MRTRAFRRHHQERILENRVRNRYRDWHIDKSFAKTLSEVKNGEYQQNVRTQAASCSCWMCSKSNKFSKRDRVANKKVSGVFPHSLSFFIE